MSRAAWLLIVPFALATRLQAQSTDATPSSVLVERLAAIERQLHITPLGRPVEPSAPPPPLQVRVQTAGRITVVVPDQVPRDVVEHIVAVADSTIADFGGIPGDDLRGMVLVDEHIPLNHAILASASVRGHAVERLSWGSPHDTLTDRGHRVGESVARHFWTARDTTWRNWLPYHLGIGWSAEESGGEALVDLASSEATSTGKQCLAGVARACRLWLALDADSASVMERYTVPELMQAARSALNRRNDVAECAGGGQSACLRAFARGQLWTLRMIPAPDRVRTSLLRAVRVKHGAEALQRALADTAGSVGARLSRAAGISEDSLVTEWRLWVLARGRPDRVNAGAGEFLSTLIFISALLAMALRSGRWR